MRRSRIRVLAVAAVTAATLLLQAPPASADGLCAGAEVLGVGAGACVPAP